MAQPPRRDIRKDPGRDQHCTRSCILAPEILDTVCVRGRLPRTIVSPGRTSHPDFSQTSAVVFSSSSFPLFSHSLVVFLHHFTRCSCRTFPAPPATTFFRASVFRAASSLRLELTGSPHLADSASLFICPAGHLTFTALARCQSPRSSPVHAERIPICPVVDTLIKVILTLTCKLSILHVDMSSSLIMSRSLEKPDTIKLPFSPYQFSFSSFDFITHHYIFIRHSHIGYHFLV